MEFVPLSLCLKTYNAFFGSKKTSKLVDDMDRVFDEVVPCFPPKYDILDLYVTIYHQALFQLFTEISKTAPQREFSPVDTINLGPSSRLFLKWQSDWCLVAVKWIRAAWLPQLNRLGIEEKKPDLLESLDMLIDEFKSRIYVRLLLLTNQPFPTAALPFFRVSWKNGPIESWPQTELKTPILSMAFIILKRQSLCLPLSINKLISPSLPELIWHGSIRFPFFLGSYTMWYF